MSTNTDAQLAAQTPARRIPAFDQVLPAYQADPAIRKHAQDNRRIWRDTNGALEVAQKHVIEFTLTESYWDHKPLPSAQFLRWHNKHVFLGQEGPGSLS
jgi:hypothetical protein